VNAVVNGHKIIVGVAASRDPACFVVCQRSCEESGVDSLAVDFLFFDTPHWEDVGSVHELLQRLVHEQQVAAFEIMRVLGLLG
jgi:hypothetical protein